MATRRDKAARPRNPVQEVGVAGSLVYAGQVREEFTQELAGQKGRETFREMRWTDSMIGSVFYAMEKLAQTVKWHVDPGDKDASEDDAKFIEEVFFGEDMTHSWTDFLSETFSTLTYGWSIFEVVYKPRNGTPMTLRADKRSQTHGDKVSVTMPASRFDDGRIGIAKIAIRSQDTLYRWHVARTGELIAMEQQDPITAERYLIPVTKALHLTARSHRRSPEGVSLLRNCYRAWWLKKRIEHAEANGIDRDMTGLPIARLPSSVLKSNRKEDVELVKKYEDIVSNLRQGQGAGVIIPSDMFQTTDGSPSHAPLVNLELMGSPGQRTIDTDAIIHRYDRSIARTLLCDFMALGGTSQGNFALSKNLSSLFITSLMSFMDIVEQGINRQIMPTLCKLNGIKPPLPQVRRGNVVPNDLEALATFLHQMVAVGAITLPDEELENVVRGAAGLPDAPEMEERQKMQIEQGEVDAKVEGLKAKAKGMNQPMAGQKTAGEGGGNKPQQQGAGARKPGQVGGKPTGGVQNRTSQFRDGKSPAQKPGRPAPKPSAQRVPKKPGAKVGGKSP